MRYVCPACGEPGESGTCATDHVARVPAGTDTLLGTTIGSWRVASVIGAGGMGRVYKAVQPAIGARVAIKVLKRECASDPDLVERFFNEARAVNLIRHDNIVDVIDLGRLPDGAPYIVMEFLEGASLAALLKRDGVLSLGALARLVGEVLSALEAAHAKGIIHRDLKPDNVYVSPRGRVTVLDFGVAKLVTADGTNPTQTGSLLGTPAYMSPEQARGQPLDARTDLYAAGVILYEGATGGLPFSAASLYEMLDLQVKAAPPPPRSKNAEIPRAFEAVILRALAKDPADRFATAKAMREALAAAAAGLPTGLTVPVSTAALAGPPSDPFAATAASTQGSLARGETMPSSSPAAPVARSRRARPLVALGLAGLVVGGYALKHRGRHRSRAEVSPAPASVPDANAMVTPAPPRTLEEGDLVLHVPDAHAFDPRAYIATATALATTQVGKVALTGVNWHGFDRTGLIDLTRPHAAAQFQFVALDRLAAKDAYCALEVRFEDGEGIMSLARVASGDPCGGRRITVHCALTELWKRAEAEGLPATALTAGANYNAGYWYVSSPDAPAFSGQYPDDCP